MNHSIFSKVIESESQYRDASRSLSQKKRPPAVLRLLMNSFESYRQARKYGWSRPWNKVDLMNFQSFRLNLDANPGFLSTAKSLLQHESENMPAAARDFHNEFLNDPALMAFIFVHEYTSNGKHYEGATLSLGRVNNKRYRDRIDIIVESPVINGISQGLERARIYIDPYSEENKKPLWQSESGGNIHAATLFSAMSNVSWHWAGDKDRTWDHWTSDYIDYFGARQWDMKNSYFYVEHQNSCRLPLAIPAGYQLSSKKYMPLAGAA